MMKEESGWNLGDGAVTDGVTLERTAGSDKPEPMVAVSTTLLLAEFVEKNV